MTWLGDFDPFKQRFYAASAELSDGVWQMYDYGCTPRAVMYDGIDANAMETTR